MPAVVTRFAPSPTGRLHPGNARTALVNALFARKHRGRFVLRIDDTDPTREEPGAVDAIRGDLAWLGILPDGETRQAERAGRHREAARALVVHDHAYDADGAIRLRLGDATVRWTDLVHGPMAIELRHLNDPVLLRADGRPTYTLASVVDDLDGGVTHVIRGDDHLTNSAAHLRLIEALGAAPPALAHLPLVIDATTGAPLSKRDAAITLAALRGHGVEPEPLVTYLAGLGTGRTPAPDDDVAAGLDLGSLGRASPVFDPDALVRAQERWLQTLDLDAVNARLRARGHAPVPAGLFAAVRGNLGARHGDAWQRLSRLRALEDWRAVIEAPLAPAIAAEDAADLTTAADLLDDAADAAAWLDAVSAATGRKGKRLRLPIRLALSARPDGPPLADLLALIGPERARRRLRGRCA